MVRLSVIIRTQGDGRRLGRCLESVRWADQLVVAGIDAGGRAGNVAREHHAEIAAPAPSSGPLPPDAGFGQAAGDWVLVLRSDEEVPPDLAGEIRRILSAGGPADGYVIRRMEQFHGRPIRHGERGHAASIRLWRKDRLVPARDSRPGTEHAVNGRTGLLSCPLRAFPFDGISDYLRAMNRETSLGVSGAPARIPGAGGLVVGPLSRFLRSYVALGGWRDGAAGFLLAALDSISELALRAKLWEHHAVTGVADGPPVDAEAIGAMERRYGL